ncbi:MAG: hypothetical protein QXP83_07520 [Candidatus Nezhaarchaeales archaeon]
MAHDITDLPVPPLPVYSRILTVQPPILHFKLGVPKSLEASLRIGPAY